MQCNLTTNSADQTTALGVALGTAAAGQLAFLLAGEYGTGKTTFVQGIARGLGISGAVRSPSYNIVKTYDSGRITLIHADLYRTHSTAEIDELGLADLLPDPGILAVEWPGRLADIGTGLAEVRFTFEYGDAQLETDTRRLQIETAGDCPPAVLEVLNAAAA